MADPRSKTVGLAAVLALLLALGSLTHLLRTGPRGVLPPAPSGVPAVPRTVEGAATTPDPEGEPRGPAGVPDVAAPTQARLTMRVRLVDRLPPWAAGSVVRGFVFPARAASPLATVFDTALFRRSVPFDLTGLSAGETAVRHEPIPLDEPLRVQWRILPPGAKSGIVLREQDVVALDRASMVYEPVDFDVHPGFFSRGRVVNARGAGLPQVAVHVSFDLGDRPSRTMTTTSDTTGHFGLVADPSWAGNAYMEVGALGGFDTSASRVAFGSPRGLRLMLETPLSFVKVVDHEGRPVESFGLSPYSVGKLGDAWADDPGCQRDVQRREGGMVLASTRTIAEGTRVHVCRPGLGEYAHELTRDVEPGEIEPYTIRLPPSPTTGRLEVTCDGVDWAGGTFVFKLASRPRNLASYYRWFPCANRTYTSVAVQWGTYEYTVTAQQRKTLADETRTGTVTVGPGAVGRVRIDWSRR